jgi:dTDP-glucose 4,6-dehydratase
MKKYNMPYLISNCSNNYGQYQFPEKLIPLFINNILNNIPLPVYGDGNYTRDWLYVQDHACAIDSIFHNSKNNETYNVGGFNEWKNIDLVKLLCKKMDEKLSRPIGSSEKLITYVKDRAGHDLRYAIDANKIKNDLNWYPSVNFEEGLSKTIDWYSSNKEWLHNASSGKYKDYYLALSLTYVINFSLEPIGLESFSSIFLQSNLTRSMFFHSLKPPTLYVSLFSELW